MTIIPAKSSIEKTCVKSLSSTCVFPQHFVMKFFKHTEKLKQFYSNICVSTIHILPLTSYFVTHLSIYGVILFWMYFKVGLLLHSQFVNKTHIETCKTAQSENNLTKEGLALFEPVLSELVKSMITLQLLVLRCSSVSFQLIHVRLWAALGGLVSCSAHCCSVACILGVFTARAFCGSSDICPFLPWWATEGRICQWASSFLHEHSSSLFKMTGLHSYFIMNPLIIFFHLFLLVGG